MVPALLAIVAAIQTPVEGPNLRCAGGAMIFFAHGSAQISTEAANRLMGLVIGSRSNGIVGLVRIESGGDGYGSRFKPGLSRRRSEAIQTLLARMGHRSRETVVVVGEDLRRSDTQRDDDQTLMGWVAQRLPLEEFEHRFSRDMIVECF